MKAYNKKIDNEIAKLLKTAKRSVFINVPWFTSQPLFHETIRAAQRGIDVRLIIEDDDTNRGTVINHTDLVTFGGKLYWHKKALGLNHEKYCIIDDEILIYGSFNWTYMASTHNIESILVSTAEEDGPELIEEFRIKFLAMLQSEDVVAEMPESKPTESEQLADMESTSKDVLDMTLGLKARIYLLESECAFLEQECQEIASFFASLQDKVRFYLADLILEKLYLQKELAKLKAQKTRKKVYEEEANEREQEIKFTEKWISQASEDEIEKAAKPYQDEIRTLYHKAVRLAHPDKFQNDPATFKRANEIMVMLNEAYKARDIETIKKILFELESGLAFKNGIANLKSQQTLQDILSYLEKRKTELVNELESLKTDELYKVLTKEMSVEEYLEQRKKVLTAQIKILQQHLKDSKA